MTDPGSAEELVKDVAANSPAGGLLLVGFRTTTDHGDEIIDAVHPVPHEQVDLDRHRKLIRERIIPPPRNLVVTWIDHGHDHGLLVLDLPAQPPARLPYVVPGPTRTGKVSQLSVAIPVREADGNHWLPQAVTPQLLAAGWTATGGPSEEALRSLAEQTAAATLRGHAPAGPVHQIGQGDPIWTRAFQKAIAALAGQPLHVGDPAGDIYHEGPGIVQQFDGQGGHYGWALTALPSDKPVMVAEPIWEALRTAGSGAPRGQTLAAIGYPVLGNEVTALQRVIDASATVLELSGGTWGPGRLMREEVGAAWRWVPEMSLTSNRTRAAEHWTGGLERPQLRVRAVASLPWAIPESEINTEGQKLLDALPHSELTGVVSALSLRREAELPAAANHTPAGRIRRTSSTTSGSRRTSPTKNTCTTTGANEYTPSPPRTRSMTCANAPSANPTEYATSTHRAHTGWPAQRFRHPISIRRSLDRHRHPLSPGLTPVMPVMPVTGPGIKRNAARHADCECRLQRTTRRITTRTRPHTASAGRRHTFVTTMLDAGVDLRDVQIAARHADPRTTMRYDRARNNLDRHPNYILAAFMASGT